MACAPAELCPVAPAARPLQSLHTHLHRLSTKPRARALSSSSPPHCITTHGVALLPPPRRHRVLLTSSASTDGPAPALIFIPPSRSITSWLLPSRNEAPNPTAQNDHNGTLSPPASPPSPPSPLHRLLAALFPQTRPRDGGDVQRREHYGFVFFLVMNFCVGPLVPVLPSARETVLVRCTFQSPPCHAAGSRPPLTSCQASRQC